MKFSEEEEKVRIEKDLQREEKVKRKTKRGLSFGLRLSRSPERTSRRLKDAQSLSSSTEETRKQISPSCRVLRHPLPSRQHPSGSCAAPVTCQDVPREERTDVLREDVQGHRTLRNPTRTGQADMTRKSPEVSV